MTNKQRQLCNLLAKLDTMQTTLHNEIEPAAAFLLADSAHGEAIIEAAQKLRETIEAALESAQVTIGR